MHVIRSSHLDSVSVNVGAFLNLSWCGNLGLAGGRCRDINLCGNYEAFGNKRHMEIVRMSVYFCSCSWGLLTFTVSAGFFGCELPVKVFSGDTVDVELIR